MTSAAAARCSPASYTSSGAPALPRGGLTNRLVPDPLVGCRPGDAQGRRVVQAQPTRPGPPPGPERRLARTPGRRTPPRRRRRQGPRPAQSSLVAGSARGAAWRRCRSSRRASRPGCSPWPRRSGTRPAPRRSRSPRRLSGESALARRPSPSTSARQDAADRLVADGPCKPISRSEAAASANDDRPPAQQITRRPWRLRAPSRPIRRSAAYSARSAAGAGEVGPPDFRDPPDRRHDRSRRAALVPPPSARRGRSDAPPFPLARGGLRLEGVGQGPCGGTSPPRSGRPARSGGRAPGRRVRRRPPAPASLAKARPARRAGVAAASRPERPDSSMGAPP